MRGEERNPCSRCKREPSPWIAQPDCRERRCCTGERPQVAGPLCAHGNESQIKVAKSADHTAFTGRANMVGPSSRTAARMKTRAGLRLVRLTRSPVRPIGLTDAPPSVRTGYCCRMLEYTSSLTRRPHEVRSVIASGRTMTRGRPWREWLSPPQGTFQSGISASPRKSQLCSPPCPACGRHWAGTLPEACFRPP